MAPANRALVSVVLSALAFSTRVLSQDQIEIVNGPLRRIQDSAAEARQFQLVTQWLAGPSGIAQQGSPTASELTDLLVATLDTERVLTTDPEFYCIIHMVSWADTGPNQQAWYLFRGSRKQKSSWKVRDILGQRLYGATRVGFLYVYLKGPSEGFPAYRVMITKRTSTPVQNILGMLEFATRRGIAADLSTEAETGRVAWGGRLLRLRYKTSGISVEGFLRESESGQGASQSIGKQTFDNEGLTWWDVSIGLPVYSVKELSYSSAGGVVSATPVDREKAYAVLDIFPKMVDPRSARVFRYVPLMVGVSMSEKPFDHLLLATGVGFKVVQLFVGVAWNNDHKPRALQVGDSATQSQVVDRRATFHYVPKFVLGLNISVTQVLGLSEFQGR